MAVRHPWITLALLAIVASLTLATALVLAAGFDPAAIPADALHGH
jgi:hypothetical protein